MMRLLGAATAAGVVGLMWPATPLQAQLPVRTYSKPAAEHAEPFTAIRGVRELADGRVVVTDPRDKVVQIIDFKTGRGTPVGRIGSGPNEYQMPATAFALPGDSTMIFDPLNSRFLMLGPGGRLAGTWSPANSEPEGARAPVTVAPRPEGGARTFTVGGLGGAMSLMSARASDAQGRLYLTGAPLVMGPDGPRSADSMPITRVRRTAMAADTLAWIQLPKNAANVTSSGRAGNQNVSIRVGGTPFSAQDGWTVFPDGRVAVVRTSDYHVEVYPAAGKGAPSRGPSVRYTPIKVTEAEKQAWRDARSANAPMAIAMTREVGAGGAVRSSSAPANVQQDEPSEWPAVMPAFESGQVHALPNGQIWVGRYRAANDKSPRFDVFDGAGKHLGQVVFPPRTTIAGFGKGVVYTVRSDEDDLQYLQRYALQ